MARALAPFQLRGKIHNIIFKVQNGRQIACMAPIEKPERHKERMLTRGMYGGYRLNILEFAMASTIACQVYSLISPTHNPEIGPILRPYTQNLLTARLKKSAERHNKLANGASTKWRKAKWYGKSIRLTDVAHALTGLDMSHPGAPSDLVRMNPIGPQHNPTAIRLIGLEKAAKVIHNHGNARLECRIHIRQAPFHERVLTPDGINHTTWEEAHELDEPDWGGYISPPSDWIPAQILPAEGLLLELPQAPDDAKYVTSIQVEWREIRTVGRRVIRHHKMGIARIVSVHGPVEAFQTPERDANLPPIHAVEIHRMFPPSFLNRTIQAKARWESNPKAYIQQALAKLTPK